VSGSGVAQDRKIAVKIHLIVALQQAVKRSPSMRWDCESVAKRGSRWSAGFDEKGKKERSDWLRLEHPERETAAAREKKNTEKN